VALRRPETFAAGLVWVCALVPSAANAHELPKGIGLVWQEGAAADALPVVVTNRGLVAKDGGIFRIRCNEAYGITTAVVPFLEVASDGTWILGTPEMVARSSDHACTLTTTLEQRVSGTGLNGYALQATTPPTVLVSVLDPERLTEERGSRVLQSGDAGRSWTQRFDNADGELFSSLLTAPTHPERVYAIGFLVNPDAGPAQDLFARSDDYGATFTRHELTDRLALIAVDPSDPDIVFASANVPDSLELIELVRSTDGGDTFAPVGLQSPRFSAFTWTPDGSSLWVGADEGLFRSRDHGATFTREQPDYTFVSCLTYRAGKLWMCAAKDPGIEGVFSKDDAAAEFTEFLTFDDVVKPMGCEDDGADEVCRVPWIDWLIEIFPNGPPDNITGMSDAGARDAGVELDGGIDAGAEADADATAAKRKSGGCSVGASRDGGWEWLALGSLLSLVCLRVRRRARTR